MSIIKNNTSQVECDYCHQLSFVDDLIAVDMSNGPDDFTTVGMCNQCAERYYAHYIEDSDGYEDDPLSYEKGLPSPDKYNEDDSRLTDR